MAAAAAGDHTAAARSRTVASQVGPRFAGAFHTYTAPPPSATAQSPTATSGQIRRRGGGASTASSALIDGQRAPGARDRPRVSASTTSRDTELRGGGISLWSWIAAPTA